MARAALIAGLLLALPAFADQAIVPGGGFVTTHDDLDPGAATPPADAGTVPRGVAPPERSQADAGDGGSRDAVESERPGERGPRHASIRNACRRELDAYLRELLEMAGIDGVEHPVALLEGLQASGAFGAPPGAPGTGLTSGVGWPVDPVQPLAWNLELRSLAGELAACVRRSG